MLLMLINEKFPPKCQDLRMHVWYIQPIGIMAPTFSVPTSHQQHLTIIGTPVQDILRWLCQLRIRTRNSRETLCCQWVLNIWRLWVITPAAISRLKECLTLKGNTASLLNSAWNTGSIHTMRFLADKIDLAKWTLVGILITNSQRRKWDICQFTYLQWKELQCPSDL